MGRIIITIDGQNLTFSNLPEMYSGNVNYDEVEFVFDKSWSGLNKTAVFTKAGIDEKIPVDIPESCVVNIPSSITSSSGIISIGVNGISNDKTVLKTSQYISYDLGDGISVVEQSAEDTTQTIQDASKIIISTDDQNLSYDDMPEIFSGDVNYDLVKFNFDTSWDGFAKTAVFYVDPSEPYGYFVDSQNDNTVKIPSVLMKESCVINIGVYGVGGNGDIIKTSQILKYKIGEGCVISDKEAEETQVEYWKQVLTSVEALRQDMDANIQSLKDKDDELANDINTLTDQDKKLFEYVYQLLNTDKEHDSKISTLNTKVGTLIEKTTDMENYLAELIKATANDTKDFLSIVDTTTTDVSDENIDNINEEVTESDSE